MNTFSKILKKNAVGKNIGNNWEKSYFLLYTVKNFLICSLFLQTRWEAACIFVFAVFISYLIEALELDSFERMFSTALILSLFCCWCAVRLRFMWYDGWSVTVNAMSSDFPIEMLTIEGKVGKKDKDVEYLTYFAASFTVVVHIKWWQYYVWRTLCLYKPFFLVDTLSILLPVYFLLYMCMVIVFIYYIRSWDCFLQQSYL